MDPDNPVIALCGQGMAAEARGDDAAARDLFERAWRAADDDYEACVAAHYLARQQTEPADVLRWNQECLGRAERVGDDRVSAFFGSLHLNLAGAHTALGAPDRALEHLRLAAARSEAAPPGAYRDWIRYAVADGLRRAGSPADPVADDALAGLLGALRRRGDLLALALLLPCHVGNLGTAEDRERLVGALRMVHAGRRLPADEQRDLVGVLERLTGPVAGSRS